MKADASIPSLQHASTCSVVQTPEHGPRIVFFSGGTAINSLSRELTKHSHNTAHLITPFDSGGSSAQLRKAFNMPAVGDLRNRLLALADESKISAAELDILKFRFARDIDQTQALTQLKDLADCHSPALQHVHKPLRLFICQALQGFLAAMPPAFKLRDACIGNLVLAGVYLGNGRNIGALVEEFSQHLHTHGKIRLTVDEALHLGARLKNGQRILGQHLLTGKHVAPLSSPIDEIFLSQDIEHYRPTQAQLGEEQKQLIANAEILCFPPGSFYSSLIANLLPLGVSQAIADSPAIRVYVPNLGTDPEQLGMELSDCISVLLGHLQKGLSSQQAHGLMDFVLMDQSNPGKKPTAEFLQKHGIQLVQADLKAHRDDEQYDPAKLAQALIALQKRPVQTENQKAASR